MRIVAALVLAPLLALTDQSVAFALVGWSCAHQATIVVHCVHAAFLAAAAACAWLAARAWQAAEGPGTVTDGAPAIAGQRRFLAGVAMVTAILATAAIASMWLPTWMISPCIA